MTSSPGFTTALVAAIVSALVSLTTAGLVLHRAGVSMLGEDVGASLDDAKIHDYLVKNPDILHELTSGRHDGQVIVGFAAETEHLLDYAARKLKDKNLDLIVANDVANPSIGFNSEENACSVIDRDLHATLFAQTSKGKIARQLISFIAQRLNQV